VNDRAASADLDLAGRISAELDRAIRRYRKGIEYVSTKGPAVGLTPKDRIWRRGTANLYRYRPMSDEVYRVPVLLVMATTNRGYIFDLVPGQSLAEFLLRRGYDVYLLDWEAPRPEEKSLRLEDYTQVFIPEAIDRVMQDCGESEVSLIGYCMGGVLSTIYAATHVGGPLKNLICFTTPIDFANMGQFNTWADRRYFDVDRLVDTLGNVPAELIFTSFEMLRPATRAATQAQVWENMWNDEFVKSYRMFDKWASDTLPLAGEYFRQIVKELMWEGRLLRGDLELQGRRADIRNINVPLLHAVAEHDHIVPYDCARHLVAMAGSTDKEEVVLKGGHVSVVAGGNAVRRLWPKLDSWLGGRSL